MRELGINRNQPIITIFIIILNIVIYVGIAIVSKGGIFDVSPLTTYCYGGLERGGSFIKVFSSMFMHSDILHILMNMYVLYFIGMITEVHLGKFFYAIAYVFTGICSGLAVIMFSAENSVTVGASGAIFGIMGVICTYGFMSKASWRYALLNPVIVNVAFTVYSMFKGGNVSAQGHFGGLISGVIIGAVLYWRKKNAPVGFYEYQVDNFDNGVFTDNSGNFSNIEWNLAQSEKSAREKKSLLGGLTVIIISGILALSAITITADKNSGYKEFYDYGKQTNDIIEELNDINDAYNERVAGGSIINNSEKYMELKKLMPKMEKLLQDTKNINPEDKDLKEAHGYFIDEIEAMHKCFESLLTAYEKRDGDYIDAANDYIEDAAEFSKKYNKALEQVSPL